MQKAGYFRKVSEDSVKCMLCPQNCFIRSGKYGSCGVRKNIDGDLYTEVYGKISAYNFDPIEKKPLYHYYPGSNILSIGSIGCNLHCAFCQNYEISQRSGDERRSLQDKTPEDIVVSARKRTGNIGISYTYNEPTVWYEYMLDIAVLAAKEDLKNVMVTNGFINKEPLEELIRYIDAFSIDLKAFTEDFYKNISFARLEPVMENMKFIKARGKHLEIVNLIIPALNDDKNIFGEMVNWIEKELGKDTVLHINRYYPVYKMDVPATPVSTLKELYKLAKKQLNYVYIGNIGGMEEVQNTRCSSCGEVVVKREGYFIKKSGLDRGKCVFCGNRIMIDEIEED